MRAKRGADRIVGAAAAGLAGADQAFEDQHVLAHAQRAEQHLAADDLAGARILDHLAVGPAAGGAVDPVDDVVADVERVGALGQIFDPEGVDIAGRLERLAPPGDAFVAARCGSARARRGRCRRRSGGGRASAARRDRASRAGSGWRARRRSAGRAARIIDHLAAERAGARIEAARLIAGLGQADQRMADDEADIAADRRDVVDLGGRRGRGEGEPALELDIVAGRRGPNWDRRR